MLMPTYSAAGRAIIERSQGNTQNITINKGYISAEGAFVWYYNQRGYFHAVRPERIRLCDVKLYEIVDYKLNIDGTLEASSRRGNYDTKSDCIKAMFDIYSVDWRQ